MEQEFSWPGLFISLSIAFFIVISSALALNFVHESIQIAQTERMQQSVNTVELQGSPSYSIDHYLPLTDNYSRIEVLNLG